MCWCTPSLRTPCCGRMDCVPPIKTTISNNTKFKKDKKMTLEDIKQNELAQKWIETQRPYTKELVGSVLAPFKDVLMDDCLDIFIDKSVEGFYHSLHLSFDTEEELNTYLENKLKYQEIDNQVIELGRGHMQNNLNEETLSKFLKEEYR